MQRVLVLQSSKADPYEALSEVCSIINSNGAVPQLIIFSSNYKPFDIFSGEMHKSFPDTVVMGTTSYVGMSSAGYNHECLSVIAIFSGIEISAGVLFDIDAYPIRYIDNITDALSKISSTENTIVWECCTAFSNREELVLDTFDEALSGTNITLIGGSAGTNDITTDNAVSLNGEVYHNACVFTFIRNLNGRIIFHKENIYKPADERPFLITSVDCENRTIYEFNEIPAVKYMANILKTSPENIHSELKLHPIGRLIDDNIYITSAASVNADYSISYYARVYNLTKMISLELDNPLDVWSKTRSIIKSRLPENSFALFVNCQFRSLMFEKEGLVQDFLSTLKESCPAFYGFSGVGEQLDNMHLNQTMIIAVFE